MTFVLEGQLKGTVEEVEREKALKQVVESSLQEKAQEVSRIEKRAITAEKSHDVANH